jgi:hypothetical protein
MTGVINVQDPPYSAKGNGCDDDTIAIQAALDALAASVSASTCPPPTNGCAEATESWPAYQSALYFPPGVYRICDALRLPRLVSVRIFGAGGLGGRRNLDLPVNRPQGSVIVQHRDNRPIFRFKENPATGHSLAANSRGWVIERLGFAWHKQQSAPANPTTVGPGAVGILFTDDPSLLGYYHGRISSCYFEKGWRGIAIEGRLSGIQTFIWNVHIDYCEFVDFTGAAIRLVPTLAIGMPNNAITNTFITNPTVQNSEPQIEVAAQLSMTLSSLDMENGKPPILIAYGSLISLSGVHLEHVRAPAPLNSYILGLFDSAYDIRGMDVEVESYPRGNADGRSGIIHGYNQASIVTSAIGVNIQAVTGAGSLPGLFAHNQAGPGTGHSEYRLLGLLKGPGIKVGGSYVTLPLWPGGIVPSYVKQF